jgi:DNA-binding PadR family transcriptional regulator
VTTRARSNPLALAVLCCLYERPMHPYEMAQTLRSRATHESIRLNFGSLYGVVASLEKRRMVRAVETVREGRRPPRTIYDITEDGRTELNAWLTELVSVPVKEFLQYEAGLALLSALPPDEVPALLVQRCEALEIQVDQARAVLDAMAKRGLARLFAIESEYQIAITEAELAFTRALVDDIESGTLSGLDQWRSWHEGGQQNPNDSNDSNDTNDDETGAM